jgi:hypothetical protein
LGQTNPIVPTRRLSPMERVVRTLMYHLYHPPISQEALRWTLTV